MTSDAQLLHATLCFLADRIGADHPDIWAARAVFSATGGQRPTQAGVDALCHVADEQRPCSKR
ncbi:MULTISPECIES: hypothetical protein [Mycobacterium]|uniref:hypothetical protein n=1 Tax=Mycobacterium TaxID=1763 RepID=UPI0002AD0596|nr:MULTISPECIES: hypothetical protein [Mycobacterium]ELR86104.1 hypothetical protein W7U_12820 [Mycobacterium sp. H4Y]